MGAAARRLIGLRLSEHPTGFGLENPDQRAGLHASLILGAFIRRELAFVTLFNAKTQRILTTDEHRWARISFAARERMERKEFNR